MLCHVFRWSWWWCRRRLSAFSSWSNFAACFASALLRGCNRRQRGCNHNTTLIICSSTSSESQHTLPWEPGFPNTTCDLITQLSVLVSTASSFLRTFLPFDSLCRRHRIPRVLIAQLVSSPPPPLRRANNAKNQPRPIASTRGWTSATATVDSVQRVILLDAAAVLGLAGKMSTSSALKVYWKEVQSAASRNCKISGTLSLVWLWTEHP